LTLTDFSTLIRVAEEIEYITKEEAKAVLEWNKDSEGWGKKSGHYFKSA